MDELPTTETILARIISAGYVVTIIQRDGGKLAISAARPNSDRRATADGDSLYEAAVSLAEQLSAHGDG
jgi:hypothetical protein